MKQFVISSDTKAVREVEDRVSNMIWQGAELTLPSSLVRELSR